MIPPDLPAPAAAPASGLPRTTAVAEAARPLGAAFAALLGPAEAEETPEEPADPPPAPPAPLAPPPGVAPLPGLAFGLPQAGAEPPAETEAPGPEVPVPGRPAARAPALQGVTRAVAAIPEAAAGDAPPDPAPAAERPSALAREAPATPPSTPAVEPLAAAGPAEPSLAAAGQGAAWRLAAAAEAAQAARPAAVHARPKEVAEQITLAVVQAAEPEVELRLDPPELGRVQIRLSHGEAGLQAVVLADRPETQDFLRRHAETLQRELSEAGYGQVSLDFAAGRDAPPREGGAEARQGMMETAALPAAAAAPAPRGAAAGLDIRL